MVICPRCGWDRVRNSKRKRLADYLVGALLLAPYRCRGCRRRFYDFLWLRATAGEEPEDRLSRAAAAAVGSRMNAG